MEGMDDQEQDVMTIVNKRCFKECLLENQSTRSSNESALFVTPLHRDRYDYNKDELDHDFRDVNSSIVHPHQCYMERPRTSKSPNKSLKYLPHIPTSPVNNSTWCFNKSRLVVDAVLLKALLLILIICSSSLLSTVCAQQHYHASTRQGRTDAAFFSPSPSSPPSSGRPVTRGEPPESCEVANIKCAMRTGCGMALQNYVLDCSDVISGSVPYCVESCSHSLLILTSTPEGRNFINCKCSDQFCEDTKKRLEVCRESVVNATAMGSDMPCTLAHLVCAADPLCSTAISYYDKYCKRMFIGRSCSARCNNSISILQRQDKAARLETCVCDGTEPFDCVNIKRNMARLCFHQLDEDEINREKQEEATNEVDTTPIKTHKDTSSSSSITLVAPFAYVILLFIYVFNKWFYS